MLAAATALIAVYLLIAYVILPLGWRRHEEDHHQVRARVFHSVPFGRPRSVAAETGPGLLDTTGLAQISGAVGVVEGCGVSVCRVGQLRAARIEFGACAETRFSWTTHL